MVIAERLPERPGLSSQGRRLGGPTLGLFGLGEAMQPPGEVIAVRGRLRSWAHASEERGCFLETLEARERLDQVHEGIELVGVELGGLGEREELSLGGLFA